MNTTFNLSQKPDPLQAGIDGWTCDAAPPDLRPCAGREPTASRSISLAQCLLNQVACHCRSPACNSTVSDGLRVKQSTPAMDCINIRDRASIRGRLYA